MAHVRSFGSILWGLLVAIVLAGIGVTVYNAGLQQGIAQSANVPAGTVPYAYYGWHGWDGGIFGLFFPILFLFILFGIARAAFGHRRGWGHGYGYGPGRWGYGPWMGSGPSATGSGDPREQWVADMHRRLHEAEATSPTGPGSSGTNAGPAGGSQGS
jgi:hypothetical protein